jgi:integrase
MDEWAWQQLRPWTALRLELPVGPLLCVITCPTRGRPWSSAAARAIFAARPRPQVRRRFAPHQLRHAHAVEMAHEGVALIVIQCQLGQATLGTPRSTWQGSTMPRSSTPSTPAERPLVPANATLRS